MRQFSHLTPRYVIDRLKERVFRRANPLAPWLTPDAVDFLSNWVRVDDTVIEYGSGRSTVWFGERVATVVSVEHDSTWQERTARAVAEADLSNVECRLRTTRETYVCGADDVGPGGADIALVDGEWRGECAARALELLKPGGLLVLDNANWFLPSGSRAPQGEVYRDQPGVPALRRGTLSWRKYWTTNGVTDTAFFFVPPDSPLRS